jgi:hypothetical protein
MPLEGWEEGIKGLGAIGQGVHVSPARQGSDGERYNPFSGLAPTTSTKKFDVSFLDPQMRSAMAQQGMGTMMRNLYGGEDLDLRRELIRNQIEAMKALTDVRRKKGSGGSGVSGGSRLPSLWD